VLQWVLHPPEPPQVGPQHCFLNPQSARFSQQLLPQLSVQQPHSMGQALLLLTQLLHLLLSGNALLRPCL
jgi:hypothetical protein